jgi:hypothetical protein
VERINGQNKNAVNKTAERRGRQDYAEGAEGHPSEVFEFLLRPLRILRALCVRLSCLKGKSRPKAAFRCQARKA